MIVITDKLILQDADYRKVIERYLDDIANRLDKGERVVLKGICSLQVRLTEARRYNHPKTGAPLQKPGGRRLAFKPSERWRTYEKG